MLSQIENRLLAKIKGQGQLTLLINTINGQQVEALFTSRDYAEKYMVRIATNFYSTVYYENLEGEQDSNNDEVEKYIVDGLQDYELLTVTHLSPHKTIYQLQSGNCGVDGNPQNYLTHCLDTWLKKNPLRATKQSTLEQIENSKLLTPTTYEYPKSDALKSQEDWRQLCIVDVDPPLPPLDTQYFNSDPKNSEFVSVEP